MSAAAGWLLQNAMVATCGALLLVAVLRRWRPSAHVEHLMWTGLVVKFLLPPLVVVALVIPAGVRSEVAAVVSGWNAQPASNTTVGYATAGDPSPPGAVPASGGQSAVDPVQPVPTAEAAVATGSAWQRTLGWVWALSALVVLVLQLMTLLRWRRARRLRPSPEWLQRLVGEGAERLGMAAPAVFVDEALSTPVAVGLVRPLLLWPARLAETLPTDAARTMVAHELAHIRRGDLWTGLLELAGASIWWWYPGWHLVRRRMRQASEAACDARVGALYPRLRRVYAEALLDVADSAPRGAPGLAFAGHGAVSMRRRLRDIVNPPSGNPRRELVIAVLLLGVLSPAWSLSGGAPVSGNDQGATAAHGTIVAALAAAAADPDPEVRRAVANALRDIGGADAGAALRLLTADVDADVRRASRSALGLEPAPQNRVMSSAAPLPQLSRAQLDTLARMLGDVDFRRRLQAANRLGNLLDIQSIPLLVPALRDPDFRVRQSAVSALGRVGGAAEVEYIRPLLADSHAAVRQSAAGAFAGMPAESVAIDLMRALRDRDEHVRAVAAAALGSVGGEGASRALIEALADPDSHVRSAAAGALARIATGAGA